MAQSWCKLYASLKDIEIFVIFQKLLVALKTKSISCKDFNSRLSMATTASRQNMDLCLRLGSFKSDKMDW